MNLETFRAMTKDLPGETGIVISQVEDTHVVWYAVGGIEDSENPILLTAGPVVFDNEE